MDQQWYSLKEMAKELGTNWQSIRSWKEQYNQFIPMDVKDKQVRFKPEATKVLRFIQSAKENGKDHHEIRTQLLENFGTIDPIIQYDQPDCDRNMLMIDSDTFDEMKEAIRHLQAEVTKLKAKWEEVEIAKRDQALVDNLREARDKKPKKGLWSRVINFTF